MSSTLTARLPEELSTPLASYCADAGITKTELVVRALRDYLTRHKPRPTAYELAMQCIAEAGTETIDSRDINKLKRKHFRDKRSD